MLMIPGRRSEEETAEIMALLAWLIHEETGGSTSVCSETAQEMLASICYILSQEPPAVDGKTIRETYLHGCVLLGQKVQQARGICERIAAMDLQIATPSLIHTVNSIRSGFQAYDPRYFACSFPASIDYQLCIAVPAQLQGIDYILVYLQHLEIEICLLMRCAPEQCRPLLRADCPQYKDLPLNLYVPVMMNLIGQQIAGIRRGTSIQMTDRIRRDILLRCTGRTAAELQELLAFFGRADGRGSFALSRRACTYLRQAAAQEAARIQAACTKEGMKGIFPKQKCCVRAAFQHFLYAYAGQTEPPHPDFESHSVR
jgi:hypothetical protein